MNRLIRIVIDPQIQPGQYLVGGVRLVVPGNDRNLGRELRTTEVRVHSAREAEVLRSTVRRTEGVELTR